MENYFQIYKNYFAENPNYVYDAALTQHLVSNGVITKNEQQLLETITLLKDKLLVLYTHIIPAKNLECHRSLIEILRTYNHTHFADYLSLQTASIVNTSTNVPTETNNANKLTAKSMMITDFFNEKYLAQGASGKVFEATFQNRQVAIKKILATLSDDDGDWKKEAEILQHACHPHVVSILGVVDNSMMGEVWIVTELLPGGSLRSYCTGEKRHCFDIDQKLQIGIHCWSALSYLHDEAKIAHKDIKPDNIMMHKTPDDRLIAKLCDFGAAQLKITLKGTEKTKPRAGTCMYFPPEIAERQRNHGQSDVYSMGATLCELLTNMYFWHWLPEGQPFEYIQIMYQLSNINDQIKRAALLADNQFGPGAVALGTCLDCPDQVRDILRQAVCFNRQQRPTASKILATFQVTYLIHSKTKQMASSEPGLRFMGPAQQQFDSIMEQAIYFLNSFWTNWNNYEQPQSYIMPPVFYYKHPEISDAACGLEGKDEKEIDKEEEAKIERSKKKRPDYITDRLSDKQKHRVYIALQQLIKEGVQSPFIAVQDLDLQLNYKDKRKELQGTLVKIFPNIPWDEYLRLIKRAFEKEKPSTAYNFVLIGPKIGLVMIEVNCSRFHKEVDFRRRNKNLPTVYKEYLGRLNSSKALIYLLKQGTMSEEEPSVRKILCTPNLKKIRYDSWLNSLTEEDEVNLQENKIGDVTQVFREDMGNLKQLIQNVLENCSETHNSTNMYEAYAPIISAIASVTVLKSKDQQPQQPVELKCVKFSEYGAVLKDGSCIKNQNPLEGQVPKLTQGSNLKWADAKAQKAASQEAASKDQIVDTDSCGDEILPPVQSTGMPKVIFLSPDQQTALKGPQRQFLVGAAGTGKTIVLQAKALELLSKNQSVAVLAPKSNMLGYQRLFEHYEELKYKIFYWPIETTKETYKLITKLGDEKSDRVLEIINDYVDEEIETRKEELLRSFDWLFSFDNVIIDDAFDKDDLDFVRPERFFVAPLLTMVLARRLCPHKLVWAALDFHKAYSVSYPYRKDDGYKTAISDILMQQSSAKSNFSVAILKQVMRCTGNIFNAAYEPKNWRQEVVPSLGHKIHGIQVTEVKKNYSTFQRALDALWKKVNSEIEQLSNRGRCANNFAIVVGTYEESYSTLKHFLKEQCKKYWPQLSDEKNDLESFVELSPETQLPSNENALTIEAWHGVSSLEWPVVIYVSCLPKYLDDTSAGYVEYQRYRAMSRATSALIDISLTYDRKEDAVEGAEKMDQSPSMSLIDGWNLELKFLGKIPDTSGPLELTVKRMETNPPLEFDKTYYHNCTRPKGRETQNIYRASLSRASSNRRRVLDGRRNFRRNRRMRMEGARRFFEKRTQRRRYLHFTLHHARLLQLVQRTRTRVVVRAIDLRSVRRARARDVGRFDHVDDLGEQKFARRIRRSIVPFANECNLDEREAAATISARTKLSILQRSEVEGDVKKINRNFGKTEK